MEGFLQTFQFIQKAGQQDQDGQLAGAGYHVIGGLGHVHMVIGMDQGIVPFCAAQDLDCPVGNHLVGIHIGGGPGPALDGVHNELPVKLPPYDFITCSHNGIPHALIQHMGRHIGKRRRLLDPGQVPDKLPVERPSRNMEIILCPQRLNPVIRLHRHLHCSDGIRFLPGNHMIPSSRNLVLTGVRNTHAPAAHLYIWIITRSSPKENTLGNYWFY